MPIPIIDEVESGTSFVRQILPWVWRMMQLFYRGIGTLISDRKRLSETIRLAQVKIERPRLSDAPPSLVVHFRYLNCSVYDIRLSGVDGRIAFQGKPLSGTVDKEQSEPKIIKRFAPFSVVVRHWLAPAESKRILDEADKKDTM